MDMLDYAINMELEGKEYYEKQAELNKGNMLYVVFTFLANQERIHADILMRRKDNKREVPADNEKLEIKSLFSDLDDFKTEVSISGKQLDNFIMVLKFSEHLMII